MTGAPWYLYVAFVAFVVAMLLADLKLFHADEREPSLKESAAWVGVWVAIALAFGIGLAVWRGGRPAAEYFAGYLVEYSLSVDNMFIFVVIFSYFRVPRAYQRQVLFYGILGAIIFRGVFIAVGAALINRFEGVVYIFGAFLLYTAVRIARGMGEVHPEDNPVLRFFQRRFPATTRYHGQKLFALEHGRRVATPLFVTLLIVETTDILFAVDSIPAIFGITGDPFIVLTSNVFAILGLRALYFLLAGSMERFHLLKYGLATILGFVGLKMLLPLGHEIGLVPEIEIPIWVSLAIIVGVLAATAVLSLTRAPHPGPGGDEDRPDGGDRADGGARAETHGRPGASGRAEGPPGAGPPAGADGRNHGTGRRPDRPPAGERGQGSRPEGIPRKPPS